MALADVRPDGTVHIYTHNQNPAGAARRNRADARHADRSTSSCTPTPAPAITEDRTAATPARKMKPSSCRKAVGKPVRVQWMRADDFQWSTQSPAAFSDVEIGLDANGKIIAYQIDHYMPAMQDDRPIGAVIAGLPTMPAPDAKAPPGTVALDDQRTFRSVGLRRRRQSGRTRPRHIPGRPASVAARRRPARSQHAHAGTIPAEFPARSWPSARRRRWPAPTPSSSASTTPTEERVIGVLKAVRDASGWETRPSPQANPVRPALRQCVAGASR